MSTYKIGSGCSLAGDPNRLHAFFSTICMRLEGGDWGSKYPCIMKKLCFDKLWPEDVEKAEKEANKIEKKLKKLKIEDLVYDIENPEEMAQMIKEGHHKRYKNLFEYFMVHEEEHFIWKEEQSMMYYLRLNLNNMKRIGKPSEIGSFGIETNWKDANFGEIGFELEGTKWNSVEQYYQAKKYEGTKYEEEIKKAKTPWEAAIIGRRNYKRRRKDWNEVKYSVMKKAIEAKYTQNEEMGVRILKAYKGNYASSDWAFAKSGDDKYMLQNIYQKLAEELGKEIKKDRKFVYRAGDVTNDVDGGQGSVNRMIEQRPAVLLNSFFASICMRLEGGNWGSKYPAIMSLGRGRIKNEDIEKALEELDEINIEFSNIPKKKIIWNANDLEETPPKEWYTLTKSKDRKLITYYLKEKGTSIMMELYFMLNLGKEEGEDVSLCWIERVNQIESLIVMAGEKEKFLCRGDIMHSFFSTVCVRLEGGNWGSKYPYTMKDFYYKEVEKDSLKKFQKELIEIEEKLSDMPISSLVWDIENSDMKIPFRAEVPKDAKTLKDYFVNGKESRAINKREISIFEILRNIIEIGIKSNESVYIFKGKLWSRDFLTKEMSTLSSYGFELEGKRWDTVEHYYQAKKYEGTEYEEEIRNIKEPYEAVIRGRSLQRYMREDWEKIRHSIMEKAEKEKYIQNDLFAELHSDDGIVGKELIEENKRWECTMMGEGRYILGKIYQGQVKKKIEDAKDERIATIKKSWLLMTENYTVPIQYGSMKGLCLYMIKAFFGTVSEKLEGGDTGSKYPMMNELFGGKISKENLEKAHEEIIEIREKFEHMPAEEIVWERGAETSIRPVWFNVEDKYKVISKALAPKGEATIIDQIEEIIKLGIEKNTDVYMEFV